MGNSKCVGGGTTTTAAPLLTSDGGSGFTEDSTLGAGAATPVVDVLARRFASAAWDMLALDTDVIPATGMLTEAERLLFAGSPPLGWYRMDVDTCGIIVREGGSTTISPPPPDCRFVVVVVGFPLLLLLVVLFRLLELVVFRNDAFTAEFLPEDAVAAIGLGTEGAAMYMLLSAWSPPD